MKFSSYIDNYYN